MLEVLRGPLHRPDILLGCRLLSDGVPRARLRRGAGIVGRHDGLICVQKQIFQSWEAVVAEAIEELARPIVRFSFRNPVASESSPRVARHPIPRWLDKGTREWPK